MKAAAKTATRLVVTMLLVAVGAGRAYQLWNYYMLLPWTRDARIRADVVTIAPDVAGFASELRVKDNQAVHKGAGAELRNGDSARPLTVTHCGIDRRCPPRVAFGLGCARSYDPKLPLAQDQVHSLREGMRVSAI